MRVCNINSNLSFKKVKLPASTQALYEARLISNKKVQETVNMINRANKVELYDIDYDELTRQYTVELNDKSQPPFYSQVKKFKDAVEVAIYKQRENDAEHRKPMNLDLVE